MNDKFKLEAKKLCDSLKNQARRQVYEERDDQDYFSSPLRRVEDAEVRLRILMERAIIRRLVIDVLASGESLALSVFDGEETVVYRSRDLGEIMNSLMSTESDELHVVQCGDDDKACTRVAWFQCIYGNAGWEVIADYSDRPLSRPFSVGAFWLASEFEELAHESVTN